MLIVRLRGILYEFYLLDFGFLIFKNSVQPSDAQACVWDVDFNVHVVINFLAYPAACRNLVLLSWVAASHCGLPRYTSGRLADVDGLTTEVSWPHPEPSRRWSAKSHVTDIGVNFRDGRVSFVLRLGSGSVSRGSGPDPWSVRCPYRRDMWDMCLPSGWGSSSLTDSWLSMSYHGQARDIDISDLSFRDRKLHRTMVENVQHLREMRQRRNCKATTLNYF